MLNKYENSEVINSSTVIVFKHLYGSKDLVWKVTKYSEMHYDIEFSAVRSFMTATCLPHLVSFHNVLLNYLMLLILVHGRCVWIAQNQIIGRRACCRCLMGWIKS